MKNKSIALTSLLLASITASTLAMAKSPSWNHVGVGYVSVDIDDTDFEPTGFIVSASRLINENVFFHGNYRSVEDDLFGDDLEITTFNLGLGYRHELNENTDFFGQISYLNAEAEFGGASEDENGYTLAVGVKSMLTANVEGVIEATRDSLDGESETAFGISAAYFLNDEFSVGAGYQIADDANILTLDVKFRF